MIGKIGAMLVLIAACALGAPAQENVPIISGGADFLTSTQGGATTLLPALVPVVAAPLGNHVLFESRGELLEFYSRQNGRTGPYQHQFIWAIDYMQLDFVIDSHLTIVAGRFLTPFNIYNERLAPAWIHNFENGPFTYSFGNGPVGSSTGLMARGVLVARPSYEVNYTAYYSGLVDLNSHWGTGRTAGGRMGVFFPGPRLEAGFSYERYLQDTHRNIEGLYFSWQPKSVPLDVKSEWAHSPSGQGYWLEGLYRLSRFRGPDSALGRLAPVARVEQFHRDQFIAGDGLPGTNLKEGDFGLNYYLPHEIRLNGTYGRQFSSQRNVNVWNFGLTYRFLFPMWPGGSK
ncbi:MAG TPA: hypothetical protein VN661_04305 [Candidatus Acidoferrales bacterium]|nr:hypothetical protein [Candidatus Acidoferrales bacterium]